MKIHLIAAALIAVFIFILSTAYADLICVGCLTGWPQKIIGDGTSSPAIGDIDNDGDLEYVMGGGYGDNRIYAWHYNGTLIKGWPKVTGGYVISSPALADIDNDGDLEIFVGSYDGKVYGFHHNGKLVRGWPKQTYGKVYSSPAIGDIDNDGDLEIAVGVADKNTKQFYVWHHNGTIVRGFPKTVVNRNGLTQAGWGQFYQTPALADLDGDGKLEIIIGNDNANVYIWRYNGRNFPGWPQNVGDRRAHLSSPAIGDIDGDGDLEIVMGADDGYDRTEGVVYAWHRNGSIVSGWPNYVSYGPVNTPIALGDIDSDGRLEIFAGTIDDKLYAWHDNGTYVWTNGYRELVDDKGLGYSANGAVIADINHDNYPEVLLSTYYLNWPGNPEYGKIFAFDRNGNKVPGFPKALPNMALYSIISINDLDGDGDIDLSGGSKEFAYVMDLNTSRYNATNVEWGMRGHDVRHTGLYTRN